MKVSKCSFVFVEAGGRTRNHSGKLRFTCLWLAIEFQIVAGAIEFQIVISMVRVTITVRFRVYARARFSLGLFVLRCQL